MKRQILFMLLIFKILYLFPQQQEFRFKHLSTATGLSNIRVSNILKDKYGFIWMATENGLDRYDGYNFVVYRQIPDDSTSLPDNRINCIFEDSWGVLWVGLSSNGLCKFNRDKDNFAIYKYNEKNNQSLANGRINCIIEDYQKKLWVGCDSGLSKLNINTDLFKSFFDQPNNGAKKGKFSVQNLVIDKNGVFWLGTWKHGLIKFDPHTEKYNTYSFSENDDFYDSKYPINSMLIDKHGYLWICRKDGKFNKFDTNREKYETAWEIKTNNAGGRGIAMLEDLKNDNLWIATDKGLYIVNKTTLSNQIVLSNPVYPNSLTTNNIISIYKDNSEIVWLGTYDGGVNIYDPYEKKFSDKIPVINTSTNRLNRSVKSIYQDKDNTLWIGTDDGLNCLDSNFRILKTFVHDPQNPLSISIGGACAMKRDKKGRFWVGTWGGGLNLYNPLNNTFKRYNFLPEMIDFKHIGDNSIISMDIDEKGLLWFGFIVGKADCFDPESETFEHYVFEDSFIRNIIADSINNCIWFAGNGLIKLNRITKQIKVFKHNAKDPASISSNLVEYLKKDKAGNLWVATRNGLNYFNVKTEKFTTYGIKEGLASTYILSLQPDNAGYLWLSTDKGITKYDPLTKKAWNYKDLDGFIINSPYSFSSTSGNLFFGGADGLNCFNPNEIKNNEIAPPLVVTDFKIFNQSVKIGEESVLKKPVYLTEEIVLSYKESVFVFEFAALNYTLPEKNQYAYKLEGFDKNWYYIGNLRTATFTNIPPGRYTFRVKASNNDGVWNEKGVSIKIIITPPFYKTLWFNILIIIIFIIIILLWLRLRTYQLKLRQKELERIVKKRTKQLEIQHQELQIMSEKLHKADEQRIQFLINISHEFRTPLTLIINPLEKIITTKEFSINLIQTVFRNAQRLLRLINQILDTRKIETGSMKLELYEGDIVSFLENIFESFQFVAGQHKINYRFNKDLPALTMPFDIDKIEKIIFNLLSNAFKFTPDNGNIVLSIKKAELQGYIEIKVMDSGVGIEEEVRKKIFDRFYQIPSNKGRMMEGSGIGLNLTKELVEIHHGTIRLESEPGKGSIFIIELPYEKAQYEKDEFVSQAMDTKAVINKVIESYQDEKTEIENNEKKVAGENAPLLLIVEDNLDLRIFLKENFEGYRIIEAANGKEGFDKATGEIPDIIISDVMMPEMDGLEMCKKIKSNVKTSHIPIILLTAYSGDDNQISGLSTGADDYISKPFKMNILEVRVKNLLESRKKLREQFSRQVRLQPKDVTIQSLDELFINKAIETVEQNMSNTEFDIQAFTISLGMSRTQLFRKFQALLNQSPADFIMTIRLKRSEQLLSSKQFSVSEVAYRVGFKYANHFSRCFREQYGMTPTEFIEKV